MIAPGEEKVISEQCLVLTCEIKDDDSPGAEE